MSGERERSHGEAREPWLEGLLARLRYRRSLAYLRGMLRGPPRLRGLDLGCGYHGAFVRLANQVEGLEFRGADRRVDPGRGELLSLDLAAPDPSLVGEPVDVVTMHAVLEHLEDDAGAVAFVDGVLRPGGVLLATVPSKRAQPVLELLAFRLGVISAAEIQDHERYYDRAALLALLGERFDPVEHQYFQLGMNNWVVATKPER